MIKKENIGFRNIDSVPQLVKDFLNHDLHDFKNLSFSTENFRGKIVEKQSSYSNDKRNLLHDVLAAQHSNVLLSKKQKENISLIKENNTFTITTGHQLNFFTGPVFFAYKILQTIKTAEFLQIAFPEHHFVPIFWMATEDHDFEEINHFKTGRNFYEIKGKSGGAVGRIEVEDESFFSEFLQEFKDSVFGTELILLLKKAYQKGNTFTDAIKFLVHQLFADYGLLTIDGDDARLKSGMKPIFKDEMLNQRLYETSKNTVKFLEQKYGKVQVNPRKINLFYLSETRNRIEKDQEIYRIVGTEISFSKEEILEELENHPEKFSPNALMRPVFQENILPNIAYIGGNAEIMYWLELDNYFKFLKIPFPILVPRSSMVFLPEKIFKKIEKSGLKIADFFNNFSRIINQNLLKESELHEILNQKEELTKLNFSELKDKAELTNKTFRNLVEAEEVRQTKSFERMKKRLLRAEKIKNAEYLEYLERLYMEIHPLKSWQERVYNFSVFYSDLGRDWLQNCYENLDVENSELIIMQI